MRKMGNKPKYPVLTLEKALGIIDLLKDGPVTGLRLKDISERLNIGKSTAHRMLNTLLSLGYVERGSARGKYRLGWKLYEVGNVVPRQHNLDTIDLNVLRNLCEKFGETVNLGIRINRNLVIVYRTDPVQATIRASLNIGEQEPLHVTALGKVLISELCIRELFGDEPLPQYTSRSITSLDKLESHLETVRGQGYAIDDEEYSTGLFCIAAPVRNYNGQITAALSISGPVFRLNFNKVMGIKEELLSTCTRLSRHFGCSKSI